MKGGCPMAGPYSVVVVPGFGGTSLSYQGGMGGKTRLWYSPTQIIRNSPGALQLASDGASPQSPLGKTLFSDGPLDAGIYEPLLTQLTNDGLSPVFWGYDWRLSLSNLAGLLATYLSTVPLTNPFYVVCHSMGGLVAQLCYPAYLAAKASNTWATTLYLGTPHGGSYWAPAALSGLYTPGSEIYSLGGLLRVAAQANPLGGAALLATLTTLGIVVGSWPGLYQLMPSSLGPWAELDPNAAALLQLSSYARSPGGQQQQWLTLAAAVLAQLNTGLSQPRPAEVCFVGTGMQTLSAITAPNDPERIASYETTTAGDGTVTAARATLPGKTLVTFEQIGHSALCYSYPVTSQIKTYLQAPTTGGETIDTTSLGPQVATPPSLIPALPIPLGGPFVNTSNDP
jgi:pimeloyl-ACP methyl ester carboxylesterase